MRNWQDITRRVLARLPFTFLVIAIFLGWEGYKRYTLLGAVDGLVLLYGVSAALSVVLAFTGLRERYRDRSD